MDNKIKEQIISISKTGLTNMFDIKTVQVIADEMGYFELIIFLEDHKKEYLNFIIKGE